jgi:hypothetical protein
MRKIGMVTILIMLVASALTISGTGWVIAEAQAQAGDEEESAFWSAFRRIFSRPDPAWSKSQTQITQTTGTRGIDEEGKLKKKTDYESVKWMESYKVDEQEVMKFLQSRGLGPYKGKARKGADNEQE